jgi:hypothetical protein
LIGFGVDRALGLLGAVPLWVWVGGGLGLALWWQTDTLREVRDELASTKTTLTVAQDANDSLRKTSDDLRTANTAFAEACEARVGERDTALKVLRGSEAAARHRASILDREIRRLAHDDPTVDAWLRAPVPDALADRLRRTASDRSD